MGTTGATAEGRRTLGGLTRISPIGLAEQGADQLLDRWIPHLQIEHLKTLQQGRHPFGDALTGISSCT